MAKRDIVVIGASAGGVTALKQLVATLPLNFTASVFIVQHVSPHSPSLLPQILTHSGSIKATHPKDGEIIQAGQIYVAPPDHHILIEDNQLVVKQGPKENRFRPSIDALFRSAAYTYGPRVIGIILTGMLNDGTSGMWSVKRLGGVTIIQQPEEALYPSMPDSVLEYVDVDYIVPIADMVDLLNRLTTEEIAGKPQLSVDEEKRMAAEITIAAEENAFDMGILKMGQLSPLACPECSGVLVSIKEGKLIRYRCHTGHAYTAAALLAEVTQNVEEALWKSVRGLEETILLLDQSAEQFAQAGNHKAAEEFSEKARETREKSRSLHEFIYQQKKTLANQP
ncbi:chemotaxis protein CheB [Larkinella knui]|uniref:protein-glutamate methylesterase n=1 Tax=Larkinella knui TaxID=2025310 RepID=A0A3P1CK96_9BACT|nr:chemotaxis protein CheB [Larkinella knui]RRB13751.1 chemotaxis protein CheB [Larkinella knui]